jgi:hypothetical protein
MIIISADPRPESGFGKGLKTPVKDRRSIATQIAMGGAQLVGRIELVDQVNAAIHGFPRLLLVLVIVELQVPRLRLFGSRILTVKAPGQEQ